MQQTLFCPVCEDEKRFSHERRDQTYDVRGESITLTLPLWICDNCGNSLVDASFGDPVEVAFKQYRESHGLLSPEQIQRIRTQWRLSQQSFAALLGMSPATINRYEQGSLPETTHSELIWNCNDRTNMLDLLDRRGNLLTERQQRKLRDALHRSPREELSPRLLAMLQSVSEEFRTQAPSILTGFRPFDEDRYAATVLWFCRHVPCVTQTKLYKLLFYADFLHYREFATSLTGSVYLRFPHGPVPDQYELQRMRLEHDQLVEVEEVHYENGNTGEEFHPGSRADEQSFEYSRSELEVFQAVAKQLGSLTPAQISDRSHREDAWLETPAGQPISYAYAMPLSVQIPMTSES